MITDSSATDPLPSKALADALHSKAPADLLHKLLAERRDVLVAYSELARCRPFEANAGLRGALDRLCQLLVDYVALGHFEVYQALQQDLECSVARGRLNALAKQVHPAIAETTRLVLGFNDRCSDQQQGGLDGAALEQAMSELGEALATRVEMEDRLIGMYEALDAPAAG